MPYIYPAVQMSVYVLPQNPTFHRLSPFAHDKFLPATATGHY